MPSTLVHVAVAVLVGTALLGRAFDARSVAVVAAVATLPDLDAFAGLVLPGTHRALLHTLLLPALAGAALAWDTRLRDPDRSAVRARWGPRGVRVAWVALAGLLVGGILPDLFTNGVNALYPLHDAFYTVDGRLALSNQRGVVQTFVDLSADGPTRTTSNTHYSTGVDPSPGAEPENVERVFLLVQSGFQLLLVLAAAAVVTARLYLGRADGRDSDRSR